MQFIEELRDNDKVIAVTKVYMSKRHNCVVALVQLQRRTLSIKKAKVPLLQLKQQKAALLLDFIVGVIE